MDGRFFDVKWETILSFATLSSVMFGMWWNHEQDQVVDNERLRQVLEEIKNMRAELIEIERRLPR